LHCGAEFRKGELGVVASGGGFGDRGFPLGEESGKKDGRFDLSTRHRHFVMDRAKPPAVNFERRKIIVAATDIRPHLAQRSDHALHGALLQRSIAGDSAVEGLPRENTGEQADGGAGIFGVERAPGALETATAVAGDLYSRALGRDAGAERLDAAERAVAIAGGREVSKLAGAFGECGKQRVAVRDGFVAGEFETAREGMDRSDGFRFHDGGQFSMRKSRKSAGAEGSPAAKPIGCTGGQCGIRTSRRRKETYRVWDSYHQKKRRKNA